MSRAGKFSYLPSVKVNRARGTMDASLYVVEFSNGIVKIGRTESPRKRVTQLNRDAARIGARVTRCTSIDAINGQAAYWAEKRFIDRMTRIANPCRRTLEFFSHTRYGVAVTLLRQVARTAA